MSSTRTRFAPSPTGALHIGNVRTALFNALLARRDGGVFVLRVEDTDAERSRAEFVDALKRDLRWLGLDWQEGPDVGGDHGPYAQSERAERYRSWFERLEADGHAYPCFCTPVELEMGRKAQRAAGRPPRYPGTCARLEPEQAAARLAAGEPATLRFRVPQGQQIEFDDLVRGHQAFASDDIGDFVIRRADGSAAFFFCNALDDALMGITHVLRGEDHIANTPRQLLLLRAMDKPAPVYGHISLIVGEDGSPLSKRHGAASVNELREQGYLPEAVLNHLARLGHVYSEDGLLSGESLADGFAEQRLGRAPARHDLQQLMHWQKEALSARDDAAVLDWLNDRDQVRTALHKALPVDTELAFVQCVRDNITLPGQAVSWARKLFAESGVFDTQAQAAIRAAGVDFFATARAEIESPDETFRDYAKRVGNAAGVKGKGLFQPLRAAFSGELATAGDEDDGLWQHGPEMGRLWPLLGRERIGRRLALAQSLCESE